jgi:uncharacterized protein YkwD
LAVLIGLFIFSQSSLTLLKAMPALPYGLVLGYSSSINPADVVTQTNVERAKLNLQPLTVNQKLTEAAVAKANHMFQADYWAHIAPDGTTPWTFIKGAQYDYSVAGENLARDFADTPGMLTAWMNSPTHKENIVNPKYREIGIAVVDGKLQGVETTLVVQMFGTMAGALPQISENAEVNPAPAAQPVLTDLPEPAAEKNQILSIPADMKLARLTAGSESKATKTMISPLMISKAIASSMVFLIIGVLLYDALVMHQKNLPRLIGKNWAHLTFYSVILVLIVALSQGKII